MAASLSGPPTALLQAARCYFTFPPPPARRFAPERSLSRRRAPLREQPKPCRALPSHASPRRTLPSRTPPRHAIPGLAALSHRSTPSREGAPRCVSSPSHARPSPALPYRAAPSHTSPRQAQPSRASPCRARRRFRAPQPPIAQRLQAASSDHQPFESTLRLQLQTDRTLASNHRCRRERLHPPPWSRSAPC